MRASAKGTPILRNADIASDSDCLGIRYVEKPQKQLAVFLVANLQLHQTRPARAGIRSALPLANQDPRGDRMNLNATLARV
ncbi:MAG: hypothetical protein KF909_14755, partial [Rhodocyclaceae bacterium]|nr:hypothetical protein [Rhodocyclaceae bacterium]